MAGVGVGGPLPKRSSARRRTNKPALEVVRSDVGDELPWPAAPREWGSIARIYYEALQRGGMAEYHAATDRADAFMRCEVIHRAFTAPRLSAQLLAVIDSGLARHGVLEGDRRRLRIELEHTPRFEYPPSLAEFKRGRTANE